jgi:hypothetical protein
MFAMYLNSKAMLTPVTTDITTGAQIIGTEEEIRCQVVDETEINSGDGGTNMREGSGSLVVTATEISVKAGDRLQITEVRGTPVDRKTRVVKSVAIVGGFRSSHKELLI